MYCLKLFWLHPDELSWSKAIFVGTYNFSAP